MFGYQIRTGHLGAAYPLPLTLGAKEEIRGRFLRQNDGDGWYCVDCLSDLPASIVDQNDHICS